MGNVPTNLDEPIVAVRNKKFCIPDPYCSKAVIPAVCPNNKLLTHWGGVTPSLVQIMACCLASKMLSGKCRPFCLGHNVFTHCGLVMLWHMAFWSALIQVMACHLSVPKLLPGQVLTCLLCPQVQTSLKIESKYQSSVQENSREKIVCEMLAILLKPLFVNADKVL